MRRSVFNFIEDMMRDYPHYNDYIKECEEEIRHPYVEPDANVGGGSSPMRQESLTDTIVKIDEDRRIRQMRKQQRAISKCLAHSHSSVAVEMCQELYFKDTPTLTLEGVSQKLNASKSMLSRHRLKLFDAIAKELGIL